MTEPPFLIGTHPNNPVNDDGTSALVQIRANCRIVDGLQLARARDRGQTERSARYSVGAGLVGGGWLYRDGRVGFYQLEGEVYPHPVAR